MNAAVDSFYTESARSSLDDVKIVGASMTAGLRANSSIPYSVIPTVIESCNAITNTALSTLASET